MRSFVPLLLPLAILAFGAGGAFVFRKAAAPGLEAPLLHSPGIEFRVSHQAISTAGPVHAAPLTPAIPKLLGRIEEEPSETRPLGVAKDMPQQQPPLMFTDNAALESAPLDGLDD